MEYRSINDFCKVSSSKRIFANQYVNEGIPFYRQKEIIDKSRHQIIEEPIYISSEAYEDIKSKYGVPQKGDLLLTAVGVTLGIPYIVDDEEFYFKDGNLIWLSNFSDDVNSKYVYYWISSDFGHDSIYMRAIGSAQPAITIDMVKKYKLYLPERSVQDKVVEILSSIDEMIANNIKRIKLLEQMAENLYKEWFVRFRFPGHEDVEIENGLPRGWKNEKLFDIAEVKYGYSFASDEFCEDSALNPVVRIRDVPNNTTKTFTSEKCDDKYLIKENSILVGMDGIFHMCLWSDGAAYLNQRVVQLDSRINNFCNYLLYFSLYPQVKFWEQTISGTTVAHLGDKHLKKMRVIIPNESILDRANDVINKAMIEIANLRKCNKNLIKQRDLLLPRLMSGKLEVK